MNEPAIDNLFSAAPPRQDVGSAASSRRGDDESPFDNHLRQAAVPVNDQSAEPWWRSAPDRRESDRRPPDFSPQPSPSPLPDNRSPRFESGAAESSAPSKDDDKPFEHDADPSAAAAGVTAAAQYSPPKPAADKRPADKPPTDESTRRVENDQTQGKAANSPASSATKRATPATANSTKSAAISKGALATRQDSSADAKQPAAKGADSKNPADATHITPASTDTEGKPAKAEAATQQNEQPPQALPVDTAATVAANESNTEAANNSEQPAPTHPNKVTSERASAGQQSAARSVEQVDQSSAKRSTAIETTSAAAKPADAASTHSAATASANADDKPDVKKKDSTSADDGSAVAHPRQVAAARAVANQPTPNVAAVTAASSAENGAVKDIATESASKIAKATAAPKGATLAAFGRLDRDGALSARGPRQASDTPEAPQVDPARFVSRVARAIETAQDRGGPLNLRLSPPELGSMRLELSVKQGVMSAKIETETAAARQTLLDNLPSLRDRLAEQNVRIDRFDVNVRRETNGDQSNQGPQQRQFQQHQQQYQTPSVRPATAPISSASEAPGSTPAIRMITDTTINLVA
jgi:flagellar hook-length control protein FliK